MSFLGISKSQLLLTTVQPRTGVEENHPLVFGSRFERILTGVEVFADWCTVLLAIHFGYAAYIFLGFDGSLQLAPITLLYVSGGIAIFYVILLDRDGAYRPGNSLLRIKETERSLRVSAQALFLVLPVTFLGNAVPYRWVVLIALLFVPLFQLIEKQLLFRGLRALHARNIGVQPVMIYGAGASGRRILSAFLRSPKLGLLPVGLIDDDPSLEGQEVFEYAYRRGGSVRVISGPLTQDLLRQSRCQMLIIAIPSLGREKFLGAVQAARDAGVRLAYIPGQAIAADSWTEYADIDGTLLSVFGRPGSDWLYESVKRAFDLVGATLLLFLTAPIMVAIAIMIRLDSPGPVLFQQKRVGQHGKLFTLYKFRSMTMQSPSYELSPTASQDPRITRFGRFLRRTSLDELAQLINVVKGEMSLVGPRPEMPFLVAQHHAAHNQRLRVKPGITGLWQLSADRAFQIHENVHYDLYYIRHRGFFMDFAILLHTLVFAMRGV